MAGSTFGFADGTGTAAQFNSPQGIAIDGSGTVYIADTNNHRIREAAPSGVVTTLTGPTNGFADGTGTAAKFYSPTSLDVDSARTLYATDSFNHRIRMISPSGVVTTFAGSGVSGFADGAGSAAKFYYPRAVAVSSSGTLYVGDASNQRIRKIER